MKLLSMLCLASVAVAQPELGAYATETKTFTVPTFDESDQGLMVVYPSNASSSEKFPLISYAHGMAGGGNLDILGYTALFNQMASFGFVVAAPKSCNEGCKKPGGPSKYTECAGVPAVSPPDGWPVYYAEQLKAIEWARNHSSTEAGIELIDWEAGVGIAGHSMGGQSTAIAACAACAENFGIKAAVIHHAANGDVKGGGNVGVNITLPTAYFTSSGDGIWNETRALWQNMPAGPPRLYRDQTGFSHLEPVCVGPWKSCKSENPYLATFTAAWFKVYLNGDRGEYYKMIYGDASTSICKYADMTECTVQKP